MEACVRALGEGQETPRVGARHDGDVGVGAGCCEGVVGVGAVTRTGRTAVAPDDRPGKQRGSTGRVGVVERSPGDREHGARCRPRGLAREHGQPAPQLSRWKPRQDVDVEAGRT
ncbi:hypothetical protein ATM99_16585, partial [Cellulomonas sp. B6]